MNVSTVDIFCGAGGLTHGFILEGMPVVAGLDSDDSCRYAYERNNNGAQFIHAKVEDVSTEYIAHLYPTGHVKVLVGCAPCQPFSSYANAKRASDDKWKLLSTFADVIEAVQPDIVSMENVPSLATFQRGAVFAEFVARLERKYAVSHYFVNCPEYGIPQTRRRLVLFASRFGKVEIIDQSHSPENYRTVAQTIGHLPPLAAGEVCPTDPLHRASALSELNLRRIRQSVPGGTWRDWDEDLITQCHRKKSGHTYPSVYGRMKWDEPSPTITTQCHGFGNGRFGHPEQDRAISLREAALLQTFPADYEFVAPGNPWHFATIGRHIGNAVPVGLGRVIARSIKNHVKTITETSC